MLRRRFLLNGGSFWSRTIKAFKNRVASDGGTFEAEPCLTSGLPLLGQNLYDKASLILTANAYKASKIYSLKPTNGSGDFTFSRASSAMHRSASGVWESVGNNIPRLNYPVGGGCPIWLFEPARTNLFLNSFAPVTQNIPVENGSTYTVSVSGSGSAALSGAGSGTATEGSNRTFAASGTTLTVTITGSLTYCQVELGTYATSPITTTGASVTRIADIPLLTGATSIIGQTEGTIYIDYIHRQSDNNTLGQFGVFSSSNNNRIILWNGLASNRLSLQLRSNSTNIISANLSNSLIVGQRYKVAVSYVSGEVIAYINGAQVLSSSAAFAFTENLSSVGVSIYEAGLQTNNTQFNCVVLTKSRLTNAELAALTTL